MLFNTILPITLVSSVTALQIGGDGAMSQEKAPNGVKIVVVGDGAVGKTASLISYVHNAYPAEYIPTVFDNFDANIFVDRGDGEKRPYVLHLWDTAGQEDYDRLRPLSYPGTDVFLVMFSVTRGAKGEDSFEHVEKWVEEISHQANGVPFILVGNKIDLRTDECTQGLMTERGMDFVTKKQGEALAKRLGADKYMEVSAYTQEGLKSLFEQAVKTHVGEVGKPRNRIPKCLLF